MRGGNEKKRRDDRMETTRKKEDSASENLKQVNVKVIRFLHIAAV